MPCSMPTMTTTDPSAGRGPLARAVRVVLIILGVVALIVLGVVLMLGAIITVMTVLINAPSG